MTKERLDEILRMIADYTRAGTVDRATAQAVLVKEGIHTEDGRLAPKYGGRRKRASA